MGDALVIRDPVCGMMVDMEKCQTHPYPMMVERWAFVVRGAKISLLLTLKLTKNLKILFAAWTLIAQARNG